MSKKKLIGIIAAGLVVAALIALSVVLFLNLQQEKRVVSEMEELAELDKQEMENEYEQLTLQYGEMMTQINNDSIIAQLTREQMRTQQLLDTLRQVRANDAREIARLKRELATVQAVLRSYIRQVDSLNQINQSLIAENQQIRGRLDESQRQNEDLQQERERLTERVIIAAQLDATAISMTILNKRNKVAKKMKDCKTIQVSFNISRNVTAENGTRTLYMVIQTPAGTVLDGGGTFPYESTQLTYSMKKVIEYSGEETPVVAYWQVSEYLEGGEYRVSIFADGNLIGSRSFTFK